MEKRILTINAAATKAKILKDGRTVAAYARARGFSEASMAKVLSGEFPFNDLPGSVFQRALGALHMDGYLIEDSEGATGHAA